VNLLNSLVILQFAYTRKLLKRTELMLACRVDDGYMTLRFKKKKNCELQWPKVKYWIEKNIIPLSVIEIVYLPDLICWSFFLFHVKTNFFRIVQM